MILVCVCLLYTSDAADDLLCVDLGGRRIVWIRCRQQFIPCENHFPPALRNANENHTPLLTVLMRAVSASLFAVG